MKKYLDHFWNLLVVAKKSVGKITPWEAGVVCVAFLLGCCQLADPDFWWHLKTGQLILEKGTAPHTDWYTYTNSSQPWIDLHWGFQIILALLYRIGGIPLIIVAKSLLVALTAWICLKARPKESSTELACAIWLPAVVLLSNRFDVRPEILSYFFLSLFFLIIFRSSSSPRLLWLLPVINTAWVNCHSLFIFGPLVLTCFWLECISGAAAHKVFPTRFPPLRNSGTRLTRLTLILLITVGTSLINPYGIKGALFPFVVFKKISMHSGFYQKLITELEPTVRYLIESQITSIYAQILILLVICTVAGFIARAMAFRAVGLYRLLIFASFTYLGLASMRNTGFLALASGLVAVWNWSEFLQYRKQDAQAGIQVGWIPINLPRVILVMALVALPILLVTDRLYKREDPRAESRRFGFTEIPGESVGDSCQFLNQIPRPLRLFAIPFSDANTCIFRTYPRHRVFLDTRLEVNSMDTIVRYQNIVKGIRSYDRSWEKWLSEDSTDHPASAPVSRSANTRKPASETPNVAILVRFNTTLALLNRLLPNPNWKCVFRGKNTAVFLPVKLASELNFEKACEFKLRLNANKSASLLKPEAG